MSKVGYFLTGMLIAACGVGLLIAAPFIYRAFN